MGCILGEMIPNQGLDSTVRNMQSKITAYEAWLAAETIVVFICRCSCSGSIVPTCQGVRAQVASLS
jgi:hypothetical protein